MYLEVVISKDSQMEYLVLVYDLHDCIATLAVVAQDMLKVTATNTKNNELC